MPLVTLQDWEVDWATHVGEQRRLANRNTANAAHYDPNRMQSEEIASRDTCLAELAVAKFLNQYWSGSYWPRSEHEKYRHLPDVGKDIEVRRIRKRTNPLVVRERDVRADHRIVIAYVTKRLQVEVIGGARASEAWANGEPAPYDKQGKTRLLDQVLVPRFRDNA